MGHANGVAVEQVIDNPFYCKKAGMLREIFSFETCLQTNATKQSNNGKLVEILESKTIQVDVYSRFKRGKFCENNFFVAFKITSHGYTYFKLIRNRDEDSVHSKNLIHRLKCDAVQKVSRIHSHYDG